MLDLMDYGDGSFPFEQISTSEYSDQIFPIK